MSKFVMRDSFPETPGGFHGRVEATLMNLKEVDRMKKRYKLATVLVAALIGALLLAGLAYAAVQSNLLGRLFPNTTPNPQAERLVTPLNLSETKDGVTFTINEYLLDGSDLYVNWTASSEVAEPMILLNGPMAAEGTSLMDNGDPASLSLQEGAPLGDELLGQSISRGITSTNVGHFYEEIPNGPFEVTMTALFMTPVAELVKEADMTERTHSPTLMFGERGERWVVDFISDYQPNATAIEFSADMLGNYLDAHLTEGHSMRERIACYQAAYEQLGYAQTLAKIELIFTVEPDPEHIVHTVIDGPDTFEFDEFTIRFTQMDFTAASTHIEYEVTPAEISGDITEDWLYSEMWFEVYPDGKPLTKPLSQQHDGGSGDNAFIGELWGEALPETPTSVTIIPERHKQSEQDKKTMMEDHKMVIPLKQVSG